MSEAKAIDFGSQLTNLIKPYNGSLDNLKEYYALVKQYPTDESYSKFYEEARANMQQGMKDIFVVSNNIEKEINGLKDISSILNQQINDEKERNTIMKKKIKDSKWKCKWCENFNNRLQ